MDTNTINATFKFVKKNGEYEFDNLVSVSKELLPPPPNVNAIPNINTNPIPNVNSLLKANIPPTIKPLTLKPQAPPPQTQLPPPPPMPTQENFSGVEKIISEILNSQLRGIQNEFTELISTILKGLEENINDKEKFKKFLEEVIEPMNAIFKEATKEMKSNPFLRIGFKLYINTIYRTMGKIIDPMIRETMQVELINELLKQHTNVSIQYVGNLNLEILFKIKDEKTNIERYEPIGYISFDRKNLEFKATKNESTFKKFKNFFGRFNPGKLFRRTKKGGYRYDMISNNRTTRKRITV